MTNDFQVKMLGNPVNIKQKKQKVIYSGDKQGADSLGFSSSYGLSRTFKSKSVPPSNFITTKERRGGIDEIEMQLQMHKENYDSQYRNN